MKPVSNSQNIDVGTWGKAQYFLGLLRLHLLRLKNGNSFEPLAAQIDLYRGIYRALTGQDLSQARIVEIGYGQRPFRLMAMQSLGYDAYGIDLDQSFHRLTPAVIANSWARNGPYRTAKSLARRIVFDGAEYRDLGKMLKARYGAALKTIDGKVLVGDASSAAIWQRTGSAVDFVYSEDVFEHIPAELLPKVVRLMYEHMAPGAVAVITPNVFTGITGGHGLDWYMSRVDEPAEGRSPAWGHLTGESPPADTFLNKLTLARYREILSRDFTIEREEVLYKDLGRQHLTPERRERLQSYSDEELFSNNVRFVLRKPLH